MKKKKSKPKHRQIFQIVASIVILFSFLIYIQFFGKNKVSEPKQENQIPISAHIVIKNFAFVPAVITVKPNTPLIFTNYDTDTHNVHNDSYTNYLANDLKYRETIGVMSPQVPGLYSFHCHYHPEMKFNLKVE